MSNSEHVECVKLWVKNFVIGLNLCPFARHPFQKKQIRFTISASDEIENQVSNFWKEIILLEKTSDEKISNSIIILPQGFEEFEEYLLLIEICEDLLAMQAKAADFQIASFHPNYQFADSLENDSRNFTNRSPFPLIHILRSDEVEKAIEFHPNTLEIPKENEKKLEGIGDGKLQKMLSDYFKK